MRGVSWTSCTATSLISNSKKLIKHDPQSICQPHVVNVAWDSFQPQASLPVTWRHICQLCMQNMTCDLVGGFREADMHAFLLIIVSLPSGKTVGEHPSVFLFPSLYKLCLLHKKRICFIRVSLVVLAAKEPRHLNPSVVSEACRQEKNPEIFGLLPPTWKMQIKLLAPDFSLAQDWPLQCLLPLSM